MKWVSSFIIVFSIIVLSASNSFCQLWKWESDTKVNGHTLQLAVEDWSAQNDGEYPTDLDLPGSKCTVTVISILSGFMFINPFNKEIPPVALTLTENFSKGRVACGQVVYMPTGVGTKTPGYKIFCIGRNKSIIVILDSSGNTILNY